MEIHVCAIYDKKINAYQAPFYVRGLGQAERYFETEIKTGTSDMNKFPADYSLMHLGTFDDETGMFGNKDAGPILIVQGIQYANK